MSRAPRPRPRPRPCPRPRAVPRVAATGDGTRLGDC